MSNAESAQLGDPLPFC